MIEAFYSGKAGLKAHQNALDVISNNVSNVNTTAYKSKDAEFSSLLHISEGNQPPENPSNLLAGSGSAVLSTQTDLTNGPLTMTNQDTDYAVNSENGFFAVKDNAGKTYYTKDGHFSVIKTANGLMLGTYDGMTVLDKSGNPIKFGKTGKALAMPGVYAFGNTDGLLSAGGSLYVSTPISGNAAATNTVPVQGELEQSNVDLSTEMVGMITTQRGYQYSSSVVSTANQIETMVNEIGQG